MTIWSDYQTTPGDNNSAPPVGAPEGMAPSAVDDTMREMMSVVRQLGDQVITNGLDALGTMADQNANAVAITGGNISVSTLAGSGAGVTALQSAYLNGQIPNACLSGGSYNISVTHASNADTVGNLNPSQLVPLGGIILYYGDLSTVSTANWALCDGTRGTPDLRDKFVIGAGGSYGLGATGGGGSQTDTQGTHSHGGATAGYTLQLADIPYHDHGVGGQSFVSTTAGGLRASGTVPLSQATVYGQGGGGAHWHSISGDGAHSHAVPMPPYIGLYYLMRVA